MKSTYFLLTALSFVIASCGKNAVIEKKIFLSLSKIEKEYIIQPFTGTGNEGSHSQTESGKENTYFSQDFWTYMIVRYPNSSKLIFPDSLITTWNLSKFQTTADKNIDTGIYYFSRNIDVSARKKILYLLPIKIGDKEITPLQNSNADKLKETLPDHSTQLARDYFKFKKMLADTVYNNLNVYCQKEILSRFIKN